MDGASYRRPGMLAGWVHAVLAGIVTVIVYGIPVYIFASLGSIGGTGVLIGSAVVTFVMLNRRSR